MLFDLLLRYRVTRFLDVFINIRDHMMKCLRQFDGAIEFLSAYLLTDIFLCLHFIDLSVVIVIHFFEKVRQSAELLICLMQGEREDDDRQRDKCRNRKATPAE